MGFLLLADRAGKTVSQSEHLTSPPSLRLTHTHHSDSLISQTHSSLRLTHHHSDSLITQSHPSLRLTHHSDSLRLVLSDD
eukprot:8221983-Pyramimonas_sp.AAC.1